MKLTLSQPRIAQPRLETRSRGWFLRIVGCLMLVCSISEQEVLSQDRHQNGTVRCRRPPRRPGTHRGSRPGEGRSRCAAPSAIGTSGAGANGRPETGFCLPSRSVRTRAKVKRAGRRDPRQRPTRTESEKPAHRPVPRQRSEAARRPDHPLVCQVLPRSSSDDRASCGNEAAGRIGRGEQRTLLPDRSHSRTCRNSQRIIQHANITDLVAFVTNLEATAVVHQFEDHSASVVVRQTHESGRSGNFVELTLQAAPHARACRAPGGPSDIRCLIHKRPVPGPRIDLDAHRRAFQSSRVCLGNGRWRLQSQRSQDRCRNKHRQGNATRIRHTWVPRSVN